MYNSSPTRLHAEWKALAWLQAAKCQNDFFEKGRFSIGICYDRFMNDTAGSGDRYYIVAIHFLILELYYNTMSTFVTTFLWALSNFSSSGLSRHYSLVPRPRPAFRRLQYALPYANFYLTHPFLDLVSAQSSSWQTAHARVGGVQPLNLEAN